jgi:hypothetical protein
MAFTDCLGTPAIAEIWCRQVESREWEGGSLGGHSREKFSKYFLPSSESLMSCCSSIGVGGPFLQVFGLFVVPRLGELLFMSAVDLSLLVEVDGICND